MSHERRNNDGYYMATTNGTYSWSSMT